MATGTGVASPNAENRRGSPPQARCQDAVPDRLDSRQPVPGSAAVRRAPGGPHTNVEQPPRTHLHGEPRGHQALPEGHAGTGNRTHRQRRGKNLRDRRPHQRPAPRRKAAPLQCRPGQGPAAHPHRHGRRPRGPELPSPLRRPVPLRSAVESGPHRAAQRPHRPQAPAGRAGALPLLHAAAAGGRSRAASAGDENGNHQARTRQPSQGDRRRRGAPPKPQRHSPQRGGEDQGEDRPGGFGSRRETRRRRGAGVLPRAPKRLGQADRGLPEPARTLAHLGDSTSSRFETRSPVRWNC